jgi:hypothetical protein
MWLLFTLDVEYTSELCSSFVVRVRRKRWSSSGVNLQIEFRMYVMRLLGGFPCRTFSRSSHYSQNNFSCLNQIFGAAKTASFLGKWTFPYLLPPSAVASVACP